jgi:hypothetical protein
MVHHETSTTVLNPLKDLMAVARKAGLVTIVDTVSSLAEWIFRWMIGELISAYAAPINVLKLHRGLVSQCQSACLDRYRQP